jgi:hypothetical protein
MRPLMLFTATSGALLRRDQQIYDNDSRRPYALLFAGGQDGSGRDRTLGHFLPDVLAALGVEML